jgi:hypothetical protein
MKPQYHEGPEALERFEKGMTKLFQAKPSSVKNKAAAKKAVHKAKNTIKGRKGSVAQGGAQ